MNVEIRRRSKENKTKAIGKVVMAFLPVFVICSFFGVFWVEEDLDVAYKMFFSLVTGVGVWLILYLCAYTISTLVIRSVDKRAEEKEIKRLVTRSNNFHS